MSLTFRKKLNEIVESDHFGVIQIKTSSFLFHPKPQSFTNLGSPPLFIVDQDHRRRLRGICRRLRACPERSHAHQAQLRIR